MTRLTLLVTTAHVFEVDVKTVAENKGYKNAKSYVTSRLEIRPEHMLIFPSVSNKLALLKKKYNIPLSGSGAGRATTNAEDGHTSPVKGSGVKKTASARKPAAKKTQPKQAAKSESDDEEEVKKLLGESDSDEVKKPSSEADSDDDKA